MNEDDKVQNILNSFEDTYDGCEYSLAELTRTVNVSFTLLRAVTLVLCVGLCMSINQGWELRKENELLKEAINRLDPEVIPQVKAEKENNSGIYFIN